ncbi:MAG: thioredoxin [Gammaproteobacteria bacterium]|nr:thioredoxin [Gammaproteobacteria bacterium]
MVATVELTRENFKDTIDNNSLVLVDFWAEWCGPCRMFAPTYEDVSERYPDAVFGKVNTEMQRELAQMFGIRSIPTLMIFRDQIIIFSQPGALPSSALEDVVQKAQALDMDMVREQIAKQQASKDA